MKQILLATTALVMTAGVAAAEITFSGSAEMGVVGGSDDMFAHAGHAGGETEFHNDFNLKVAATGETDTGLSFGVSIEISKDEGDSNGNFSADNEAFFISGAFGTLTMGEIDGAMDWAITENVGNPGTIGDDETTHAGYFGTFFDGIFDNQIARYEYSFGDFGVAISAELDDSGLTDGAFDIGAKYKGDLGGFGLGAGLAFKNIDGGAAGDLEMIAVSVNADFQNGLVAGVAYTDADYDDGLGQDDFTHTGVSIGYTTGAFSIGANYGEFDFDTTADQSGFGIAAAYDLGGGLSVHAGYGDSDFDGVDGDFNSYSVGVVMEF